MFGIGDGNIEIQTDKTSYKKGDTIKGTLILNLKKPVKALWLRIDVVGEYYAHWHEKENRGFETKSQTTRYYWFKNQLDGKKEYPAGKTEYKFSIKIPENLDEWKTNAYGPLQNLVDKATGGEVPLRWYLQGRLDKALKFSTVGNLSIELS